MIPDGVVTLVNEQTSLSLSGMMMKMTRDMQRCHDG